MSIKKGQDTNHGTSSKTDYPSLHEIIKIEDEVRTALKSIKNKKERFREWTKSLGDSPKIDKMFVKFDARIGQLSKKLLYLEKVRAQVARGEIAPQEIPDYVARVTSGFDPNKSLKPVEPESRLIAKNESARTDELPEHDRQKETEPVSLKPPEPSAKAVQEPHGQRDSSDGTVLPKAKQEKHEDLRSEESSGAEPESPDSAKKAPADSSGSETPESEKFDKLSASEFFETILEEQEKPDESKGKSGKIEEEFTFVIEDAATEKSARSESETAEVEKPETVSEPEPDVTEEAEISASEESDPAGEKAEAVEKSSESEIPEPVPEETETVSEPEPDVTEETELPASEESESGGETTEAAEKSTESEITEPVPEEAETVSEPEPDVTEETELPASEEFEPAGETAEAAEKSSESEIPEPVPEETETVSEPEPDVTEETELPASEEFEPAGEKAEAVEKSSESEIPEPVPEEAETVSEPEPDVTEETELPASEESDPAGEKAEAVEKSSESEIPEPVPEEAETASEPEPDVTEETELPASEESESGEVTTEAAEKSTESEIPEPVPEEAETVSEPEPDVTEETELPASEESESGGEKAEAAEKSSESEIPEPVPEETETGSEPEPDVTEETELPASEESESGEVTTEAAEKSSESEIPEPVPEEAETVSEPEPDVTEETELPASEESESGGETAEAAEKTAESEIPESETEEAETVSEPDSTEATDLSREEESVQDEVTEKAIDSIFARNLVLKKKSKVVNESTEQQDEEAAERNDVAEKATSDGKRLWKQTGHSIPEEKLAKLIDEPTESTATESSPTVEDETQPAGDSDDDKEKEALAKYIRPKLPRKVLQKQYDNYLAEKTQSERTDEANIDDLELPSFEDESESDDKQRKIFSVKKIKSRFSLRRFKKSKEDKQTMETGKATVPKDTKVEPKIKEEKPKEKAQPEKEKTEPVEDKSVLYLGIDLGTSETTIAASNGVVETVLSVMGKPKDFISQKLLKAEKLFGLDALRNKLAVNLLRPMEKGVIKDTDADLEAARELVKHVIGLANPEKYEKVYAVIGAPARSSFANQQALVDAAREVVDAVMIVSEPFAVAYGEGKIYNSLVIDIGAGTTDICCLKGSMPEEEDQFTLLKAGDYIDNYLMQQVLKKFEGAQITKDLARKFKEDYSFVIEPDRNAMVEITVQGKPTKIDITRDIREACESIIPEIVTCTKNIISNFNPEFQSELKENILLAGGGSLIKNLDQYLARQLRALGDVTVTLVPDPIVAGAKGALVLAKDLTDEYWRAL